MNTGSPDSGEAVRQASRDDEGDERPDTARDVSIDMTTVVLLVVVIAIVGVVMGLSLRDSGPPAGSSIAEKDRFLQSARTALVDAQRLALDLERIDGPAELDADELRSLTGKIDMFTSQIAQVTCLAPTAMDGRVSRSVAVSSRSVSDALRNERESRSDPDCSARAPADAFVRGRTEFSHAIRDLANHVELL